MQRWGFIYTLGADATEQRVDRIGSPGCELIAVGVCSVDDASDAARLLVEQGAELVELCGAFGPEQQRLVLDGLDGKVPSGAVTYAASQATLLHTLFGDK